LRKKIQKRDRDARKQNGSDLASDAPRVWRGTDCADILTNVVEYRMCYGVLSN